MNLGVKGFIPGLRTRLIMKESGTEMLLAYAPRGRARVVDAASTLEFVTDDHKII